MCFLRFSKQTAIISLNSVNLFIVVMVTCCVFIDVGIELLDERYWIDLGVAKCSITSVVRTRVWQYAYEERGLCEVGTDCHHPQESRGGLSEAEETIRVCLRKYRVRKS
jgi:hypothetical protein